MSELFSTSLPPTAPERMPTENGMKIPEFQGFFNAFSLQSGVHNMP